MPPARTSADNAKAFAAAIDRQSLIDNVTKGNQTPAHSFAPPGIFGNVADDMSVGSFMVQASYGDQVTCSEAPDLGFAGRPARADKVHLCPVVQDTSRHRLRWNQS